MEATMSSTHPEAFTGEEDEHKGPSLLALAIVHTLLIAGSIALTAVLTGGHLPSPFESAGSARRFFVDHPGPLRLNAFLQLGGAITLGLFAATAASRLRFLGVTVAGVSIALFGGFAAAVFGAQSSLLQWVISQMSSASDAEVQALHLTFFAAGGPGQVAAAGLFVAGVSLAAGIAGWLPRWLMWFGLVIAAIAELSTLTLLTSRAAYLLPAARFPMFVWMIGVGALLPASRRERERATARRPTRSLRRALEEARAGA